MVEELPFDVMVDIAPLLDAILCLLKEGSFNSADLQRIVDVEVFEMLTYGWFRVSRRGLINY